MTNTPKKKKDKLDYTEFNLDGSTDATFPFGPITWEGDAIGATTGTQVTGDDKIIQLLTDIWHNQATIIKWLSKIAENTKR